MDNDIIRSIRVLSATCFIKTSDREYRISGYNTDDSLMKFVHAEFYSVVIQHISKGINIEFDTSKGSLIFNATDFTTEPDRASERNR